MQTTHQFINICFSGKLCQCLLPQTFQCLNFVAKTYRKFHCASSKTVTKFIQDAYTRNKVTNSMCHFNKQNKTAKVLINDKIPFLLAVFYYTATSAMPSNNFGICIGLQIYIETTAITISDLPRLKGRVVYSSVP